MATDTADSHGRAPKRAIRFRNYRPRDPKLRERVMERAPPPSVTAKAKLEADEERIIATIADPARPLNLVPKRANWDLKRDVQKKMDRLERGTQRAIAELIRRRVSGDAASAPAPAAAAAAATATAAAGSGSAGGSAGAGGAGAGAAEGGGGGAGVGSGAGVGARGAEGRREGEGSGAGGEDFARAVMGAVGGDGGGGGADDGDINDIDD